jgi:dCMP deaminase
MIIGLTGKNGAGKGEVAKFLAERGFHVFSLSDVIRQELKKKKKAITRANLIEAGNDLRKRLGPAALADQLLPQLHTDKNYVVDSIRNPAEALALKKLPHFFLFCVSASPRVRFERVKKRGRENDPKNFQEFMRLERLETKNKNLGAQQLDQTAKLADYIVKSTGTIEDLHENVRLLLLKIIKKNGRPGWDEYFMSIARMVAMRSNCIKRKVAAVLVKDRRIIATGYNGTPRGVKNCSEGGCPRCAAFGKSGTSLGECVCSHAEENAITQSAYHGVNIKGATLYTTYSPCLICTKMIINCGIAEVVYHVSYSLDQTSLKLLKEAQVKVRKTSTYD